MKLLQQRVGKKKSVFEEIKELKAWDGKKGTEEINYIYGRESIPPNEQAISANMLCEKLIKGFEDKSYNCFFDFNERPLITFSNAFMNKINILVQEEIIELTWMKNLTKAYVFESSAMDQVKVGLILAEKYLEPEELKEAAEVFTKSGEYIFYLARAIKNLPKCNSYIIELMKKATGTIKIFAITNIEVLSEEINTYLFEEGYKDRYYEEILMEYVLESGNIKDYLNKIEGKPGKINKFSYLVYNHLNNYKLKDSPIKHLLLLQYLPMALKGTSYLTLVCIVSLWKQLIDIKELDEVRKSIDKKIITKLSGEKWKRVFSNEVKQGNYSTKDIIEVAEYYNFKLSFEGLRVFFEKSPRDFSGYLYLTLVGDQEDRLKLLEFFTEKVDLEKLLTGPENISTKNLTSEDNEYIILSLLINGCRDIYPEGKDLAIKGLAGKTNDIRNESIKTIKLYKKELTLEEKEIIKSAMNNEPSFDIRNKLRELCEEFEGGIIEFVSTKGLKIMIHVKDVYLLSSTVARSRYRDKEYLKRELKSSRVFNLILESNNLYDKNSIKIVGESGFVIGYVPKKDNFILSNLLRGGRYLYCTIKEYSVERDYISINIYISYKHVIKEAETLIQMMTSKAGDFEN